MTVSDAPVSSIRVLGPIEVVFDAGLAHLGGPKQRAVLGMLTARAGHVVTTDQLVDGIWGDDPPAAVSSSIHSYISTLRTVIDWPIERHGSGYVLDVDHARIDANVFEDAFGRGRRELVARPTASADELREALALWRGRAYADISGFPGLEDEARRLTDLRLWAVEVRIEADLALGRHAAVVGELEALAAENPFRESLRAKHMLALYRDGRQAEALRAYQRTQTYLREELGVEPSPELTELEERILNHDYTLIHSREVVSEQVALLFTDVVDSTLLWETNPGAMQAALARYSRLIQSAIEAAGGAVIRDSGDGLIAAFSETSPAARAALTAQQAIVAGDWAPLEFRVRMAIDTGEVERRGGDLFGPPVTRGSRLLDAAHGSQIVLSNEAQRAVTRDAGTQVKSLGEQRFRGLGTPQRVHQLIGDGLPSDFPPLNIAGGSIELDRSFGGAIRGYELRERIGRGAFATVYRGYQPSIGREVAIKIVKPELANHPAFIRRFESEARFVASLEHPHIVSVYDYWRDADGAHIVGPYLAGRSLADETFATMSMTEAMKIASQVGSALSYAHRQGVLHRDVKPSNILLDTDGNAYLADFGIAARAVEAATGIQSKSVGYRAPEDREGGAVDVRSDLYGLAAVVARLLGIPPQRLDLGALDGRLRDVLARGLAHDPEDRYDSVDDFLKHLLVPAGGTGDARTQTTSRNPYKGLAPFTQHDALDFFGRSDEITRLVDLVSKNRLSAVIGPSGSGKSSLTLAGLLPTLAAGAVPGSETWISLRAVPGGYPFDELAIALSALSNEPLSILATELASPDGRGLLRIAKRIGHELEGDLFIVIDQFEELFTLVAEDGVRNAFATAIVTAATDPLSRVRIVLTLRADFFHQVMTQPSLAQIIGRAHLALANLDADGIRLAIAEPAARAGLRFEPGLPERIVSDLKDQPGSLPLLQFTLDRLAAAASDGLIADQHYAELGGVKGALAERAEGTFQELTDSQKQAALQIFTRLLYVSGEADDIRRRVRMTELESLGLATGDLEVVIGDFGRERLLTFDVDPTTRGATVEVAHEALLREWPTLRTWVDSRRESLLLQRRFQVALGEWEESGRSPSSLLTGGRLSQYTDWAADEDVTLAAAEQGFLSASIAHARSQAANRRARRRLIMAGFAAAAVVASLLAVVAVLQRDQAEENAYLAQARQVILEAEKSLALDPELSMLLALESIEAFRAAGLDPPGPAISVLREGLRTLVVMKRFPGGRFVAVNGDGTLLATSGDRNVVVRDIASDDVLATLTRPGAIPIGVYFSPDDTLAVSYQGVAQPVRVWGDWHTPDIFVDVGPDDATTPYVESVQWSPNGDLVAIDGREVWSTAGARKRYPISSDDQVSFAAFSTDGRLGVLNLSDDGPPLLRVLAADSGAELQPIDLDVPFQPSWHTFSPDGERLAVADPLNLAVVDAHTGALVWHTDALARIGPPFWLNDGKVLLVGGEGTPAVVEAASGNLIQELPGHRGGTFSYAQVPGTSLVASAGQDDEETIIFDLGPAPFEVGGLTSSIPGIAEMGFAGGDASLWLTADRHPQSSAIIDAATGDTEVYFPRQFTGVSPNGKFSAGFDAEGQSVLWSNSDQHEVLTAPDGRDVLGISDDGTLAVIGGPTTQMVNTIDGSLLAELDAGPVFEAVFSPDRRFVVTNNNGESSYPGIMIWGVSNGDLLGSLDQMSGFKSGFTPDGSKLVVGGYDGRIHIFDFEQLRAGVDEHQAVLRSIPAHENFILSLVVSPDGSMAFSRNWDDPVKLWDLESGEALGEFGVDDPEFDYPPAAAFHPTEPWLYATVGEGKIAIYTLDIDELMEMARSRLTRGFTEEECQLYLERSCGDEA